MNDELNRELEVTLYRNLQAEVSSDLARIQSLWWQKFILVGGTIAFVLTNGNSFELAKNESSKWLILVAVCIIPVLAALIDGRILEYALHARLISSFVTKSFRSPPVLAEWERTLWSSDEQLAGSLRSVVSVLITVGPTVGLTVLSCVAVSSIIGSSGWPIVIGVGLGLSYLVGAVAVCAVLWRRRRS